MKKIVDPVPIQGVGSTFFNAFLILHRKLRNIESAEREMWLKNGLKTSLVKYPHQSRF